MATKIDIHELADSKNIPWDDDPSIKSWSKKVTGKACLDDMSPEPLSYTHLTLPTSDQE